MAKLKSELILTGLSDRGKASDTREHLASLRAPRLALCAQQFLDEVGKGGLLLAAFCGQPDVKGLDAAGGRERFLALSRSLSKTIECGLLGQDSALGREYAASCPAASFLIADIAQRQRVLIPAFLTDANVRATGGREPEQPSTAEGPSLPFRSSRPGWNISLCWFKLNTFPRRPSTAD